MNTQNTEPKTVSFGMKIIITAKKVCNSIVQFFTGNKKKVKAATIAIAGAVVAYFTSGGTAIIATLAAIKARGMLVTTKLFGLSALGKIMQIKDIVKEKAVIAIAVLRGAGKIALGKVISVKDYVVNKAKQAIAWVKELFVDDCPLQAVA